MTDRRTYLRGLPAIDRMLSTSPLCELADDHPHAQLREAAQRAVEELRRQVLDETNPLPDISLSAAANLAASHLRALETPTLRPVLNLTGTVLHTNLGRAPLAHIALAAVREVSRGYSTLEYDLATGHRGERHVHVEELFCRLTGAEAALAVNNNAGAVLLALATLAGGRSALVSRGELIEIGGSFRIPEIMAAGKVRLIEVGTTNKTHLDDYRRAIDAETALILKVHTSNYRIIGFTTAVPGEELAALGQEYGLPVLEDLGSGMLLDPIALGLPREPTLRESIASGVSLVTCSGDKLLGGPQAGLIAGSRRLIDNLKKHPLARALRLDKMTLAALEATLRLYLDPAKALREIPTLSMLAASKDDLKQRCLDLLARLQSCAGIHAGFTIVETNSTVGGGAMPLAELPGFAIAVSPTLCSPQKMAMRLRQSEPPVLGRIQGDRLLLDPRTLLPGQENQLIAAVTEVLSDITHA